MLALFGGNSMIPRALGVLAAFATLGSLPACGGRASSPESSACVGDACSAEVPEVPEATAMPETFEILELRRLGDNPAALGMASSCEYEARIKINLDERLVMHRQCDDSGASGRDRRLDAADIELIESAYARLQPSSELRCTNGAEIITLDLSSEGGLAPDASFADDDHSDCSLPYPEHVGFVAGLDELFSLLLSCVTNAPNSGEAECSPGG
jgi:hypothetical protein